MMLGRETRLPDQLVYGALREEGLCHEQYAIELERRLVLSHQLLREAQFQLRTEDTEEQPSFAVGDMVWLLRKHFSKGKSRKLQAKFSGPYKIVERGGNHTITDLAEWSSFEGK